MTALRGYIVSKLQTISANKVDGLGLEPTDVADFILEFTKSKDSLISELEEECASYRREAEFCSRLTNLYEEFLGQAFESHSGLSNNDLRDKVKDLELEFIEKEQP